ncbi:hypothetical protein BKA69DRAFT_1170006 [Paraphysoderma sedebokerense]|nr:hypothetical protein BKA69DRAFT_1170006 [Paraphysoderma sedebokerense]
MQLQLASVLAVLALVSNSVAAPVAEPILPAFLTGAAAKFGALTLGKKAAVVGGVAATGAVVHGFTSSDKQRHAKFEWVAPNEKTVWTCGTTVTIVWVSVIGSFWVSVIRNFYLKTYEGAPLGEIMKQKTSQFIKEERTIGMGRARNGKATFSWDIPQDVAFASPTFEIQCGGNGENSQTALTDASTEETTTDASHTSA